MSRHIVIGTAGHVDHGKTALVRALTGIDTDRWEEEKRRGITIDLGFASLRLSDDLTASIVDVPGHEDFVRNMVAGATGIDVALLVVAADEGIMPQTEEHLAILEFLGVAAGVVAVSKADVVEDDWLELVVADVAERLERSAVSWSDPLVVSSVTEQGIDDLKAQLDTLGQHTARQSHDDVFRMPVDRSFSVSGAGTVVTGTTWSGTVAVGDRVRIIPGTERARVRTVEVHGEARDAADPGRRTALALPNVSRDHVRRGTVIVTEDGWQETARIDALVTLLPNAKPLTQRSRIRVHLGTAEVFARVTPQADDIAPGGEGAVRLRLESPVVARWGDRGVLRSYSPVTTVGGCVVVDPDPPQRPRRPQHLEHRAVSDPIERAREFVRLAGAQGMMRSSFAVRVGVHPSTIDDVAAALEHDGVRVFGETFYDGGVVESAADQVRSLLEEYHRAHPLEPGMRRDLLRQRVEPGVIADAVVTMLVDADVVVVEGETARLPNFRAALGTTRQQDANSLRELLRVAGSKGMRVVELEEVVAEARDLAEFLVRQGEVRRIGADRYYEAGELERVKDEVVSEIQEVGGIATPAQLRVRTGLSRKYLIPVLEWMDAAGFTTREGDGRRVGPRS